MSDDAKQRLTVSRRDLLSVIGAVSGSAAMYHAMTSLGFASDSGYKGPIKLEGDPKGASVLILGAGLAGMTAALELRKAGYKVQILEFNNPYAGLRLHQRPFVASSIPFRRAPRTLTCFSLNSMDPQTLALWLAADLKPQQRRTLSMRQIETTSLSFARYKCVANLVQRRQYAGCLFYYDTVLCVAQGWLWIRVMLDLECLVLRD